MREFQEKKRNRRFLYSNTALVFFSFLFFVMVSAVYGVYVKYSDSQGKYLAVFSRLTELEAREKNLTALVDDLANPRGVEEEIRKKFGFVKKGEQVILVLDPPLLTAEPLQKSILQDFFGEIKNYFFTQ